MSNKLAIFTCSKCGLGFRYHKDFAETRTEVLINVSKHESYCKGRPVRGDKDERKTKDK